MSDDAQRELKRIMHDGEQRSLHYFDTLTDPAKVNTFIKETRPLFVEIYARYLVLLKLEDEINQLPRDELVQLAKDMVGVAYFMAWWQTNVVLPVGGGQN